MSTNSTPQRPVYGNWMGLKSPGLGQLNTVGSLALVSGFVVTALSLLVIGWIGAVVLLVLVLLFVAIAGTPAGVHLVRRLGFRRQVSNRAHQGRSGVFSKKKNPHVRLPGMLARCTLLKRRDPFGSDFAVIKNPRAGGLYTIVVRCIAEGPVGQSQSRIDQWVSGYAGLLTAMSHESALVCAKAITDTAPDPGGRLESATLAARHPSAPEMASATIDEVVRQAGSTASENVTYVELTFAGRTLSRKGREDEILADLARKVPNVLTQVQLAGGGSVDMVSPDELANIVRTAYDPAAQLWIDQVQQAREHNPVTWDDAGPVADQAMWDHYRHDSGLSVTWEMIQPPRSAVTERALAAVLRPDRDFVRKRVAIIYRPHGADEAAKVTEDDAATAVFSSGNKRRQGESSARVKAVNKTRQEVAEFGAALIQFSVMVTATVTADDDLDQAVATVEARGGSVPLRLRRCYGSQSSAFATTLPVGFVPWEHATIPKSLRRWL